jgi:hypothetical protein
MITKGVSNLRGVSRLNTRPGPISESGRFLKLHQLAAEKENAQRKQEWIQAQKEQVEKRLSEIARAMHSLEKTMRQKG